MDYALAAEIMSGYVNREDGIMTGIHGKNELNPTGTANRAEAAKMFSVVGHDIL